MPKKHKLGQSNSIISDNKTKHEKIKRSEHPDKYHNTREDNDTESEDINVTGVPTDYWWGDTDAETQRKGKKKRTIERKRLYHAELGKHVQDSSESDSEYEPSRNVQNKADTERSRTLDTQRQQEEKTETVRQPPVNQTLQEQKKPPISEQINESETAFYQALLVAQQQGAGTTTCEQLMKAFQAIKTNLLEIALDNASMRGQLSELKPNSKVTERTYASVLQHSDGQEKVEKPGKRSVLVIKPTTGEVKTKELKERIVKDIDPAKLKLTDVKLNVNDAAVTISTTNGAAMTQLKECLNRLPEANEMQMFTPTPRLPSFKVVGIDSDTARDDIPEKILNQNNITGRPEEITILAEYVNQKRNRVNILKTSPAIWRQLRNLYTVNVGWSRAAIYDNNHPLICYYCASFGHLAKNCNRRQRRCIECAGNHCIEECRANFSRCAACLSSGFDGADDHTIRDLNCPVAQEWRERAERNWEE